MFCKLLIFPVQAKLKIANVAAAAYFDNVEFVVKICTFFIQGSMYISSFDKKGKKIADISYTVYSL